MRVTRYVGKLVFTQKDSDDGTSNETTDGAAGNRHVWRAAVERGGLVSGTIAKHSNALGWAWYLDTDEGSYWVSHPVKEYIAALEAENAKLRELVVLNWEWAHSCCGNNCKMQTNDCCYQIDRECNYEREIWDRMRELGVEVNDA